VSVFGEAGVESLHGVTVRVGMAEEDFEGAFGVNGWHNGCTDSNGFCGYVRHVNYKRGLSLSSHASTPSLVKRV